MTFHTCVDRGRKGKKRGINRGTLFVQQPSYPHHLHYYLFFCCEHHSYTYTQLIIKSFSLCVCSPLAQLEKEEKKTQMRHTIYFSAFKDAITSYFYIQHLHVERLNADATMETIEAFSVPLKEAMQRLQKPGADGMLFQNKSQIQRYATSLFLPTGSTAARPFGGG